MADQNTLAHHLKKAAEAYPQALAVRYAGQAWSFAEWREAAQALVKTLPAGPSPLILSGDSLSLARHAFACSVADRAFWPLARDVPLPETPAALPGIALIISTSGSEGQSRPVLLGNAQLDAAAAASNSRLPLGPGDLWLNCLPLCHIGGQAILWRCTRAAAGMLLHDGFDAAAVAKDLERFPISHISLVPTMLARLLELGIKPPASLRVALIGGAALTQTLHNRAIAAGWPLCPSYGMSETAAQFATHTPADGPWHEGLVGGPMSGHEVEISAEGRIRIRGPQVMVGYLDGSGVDAAGWLTSGDLGEIDGEGRLTVTGRADDMLISGGIKVHPLAVESCLAACPGVRDVAVTGLPDPVWGQRIVALVVGTVSPDTLFDHARQHLPAAARPRQIGILDRLPRNAAGKLERATLRRLAAEAET